MARLNPSRRVASVIVHPIARMLSRRHSPGCAGFSILPIGSAPVIVQQIDVDHLTLFEAEDDAPVCRHPDAPLPAAIAFERMQPQSGSVHVVGTARLIKHRQDVPEAGHEVRR